MAHSSLRDYHDDRRRHCLHMASIAVDAATRHIHERLAAEHGRLAHAASTDMVESGGQGSGGVAPFPAAATR